MQKKDKPVNVVMKRQRIALRNRDIQIRFYKKEIRKIQMACDKIINTKGWGK